MREVEGRLLPRARTDELIVRELPDELLVYDLRRDKAHCLNKASALVWKYCDGKTTVARVTRLLGEEFAAPVEDDVVWLALRQLDKFHLLEERLTAAHPQRGISRRELVRRIGVAAVLLPAIISISAPTAQAQASCLPIGAKCTTSSQCCSKCCSEDVGGTTCQASTVCAF